MIPTDESHTTFTLWSQQFNGIAEQNSMALLADIFYSNGTFERNAPLYWDKTWNLMGRKMTVATVTYLPYSITEYVVSIKRERIFQTTHTYMEYFLGCGNGIRQRIQFDGRKNSDVRRHRSPTGHGVL